MIILNFKTSNLEYVVTVVFFFQVVPGCLLLHQRLEVALKSIAIFKFLNCSIVFNL